MSTAPNNVIVVGGGVAGLAAAYHLQKCDIRYTLLEAADRPGGLVQTVTMGDGCQAELGPDAFITRKPWALELATELGLTPVLQSVNDTRERIYVLVNGRLEPLPDGLRLLVPTKFGPFWRSRLLSPWGKLRMLADWVIPAKGDRADESLGDFVRRRLGRQALERLADPLLGGVYNAEMERQSILATFPQYRDLEAKHGSLIRGMRAAASRSHRDDAPPALVSFEGGMGAFVGALAGTLGGDVRLNASVEQIDRHNNGYRVRLAAGDTLEAAAVIVATPANVSARLLTLVAPGAAGHLAGIRYEGVGSISLAYRRGDVPHPLDAYGVVIPAQAGRNIDGMQWSSAKWPGRAPEPIALLRVFFGGPHTRPMLDQSDADLLALVQRELSDLLGIQAEPLHYTIGRWRDAYPQYDVGHLDRIAQVMRALPAGVALAGNSYRGVGLPDTIHSAQQAAQKINQYLHPPPKKRFNEIAGSKTVAHLGYTGGRG